MMREWLAYGLLTGVLLVAAGTCIETALRLANRPARAVWVAALGALLLLVALAPTRRQVPSRILMPAGMTTNAVTAVGPDAPVGIAGLWRAAVGVVTRALDVSVRVAARAPSSLERWIAVTWGGASAVLLVLFTFSYTRFRARSRSWPVSDLHGTRVRIAPDSGPAAVGVLRPEIVVPRWMLLVDDAQQRLALSHEAEHLRTRDPLLLAAAYAAVAVMPWHPAAWWMLARLRLCVELDCDRRVLRRGADTRRYADVLLDLAERCSGARVGVPAFADGSTHLERRLLAMTSGPSRFVRARSGALSLLAAAAVVTACEAKLPTSSEIEHMDVASVEHNNVLRPFVDSTVTYVVDGKVVHQAYARMLTPEQIASVEVRKPGGGTEHTVIYIRTVSADTLEARTAGGRRANLGYAVGSAGPVKVREVGSDTATRFVGDKFAGLVVIDGVVSETSALSRLDRKDIESVEVLKGAAATKLYAQPQAVNGVIVVRTKRIEQ